MKNLTFWSDSTTAISWIQRNDEWGTSVGNRVRKILSITESKQWSYIPGKLNPADLASQDALHDRWWEGPVFLKSPPESWPHFQFIVDEKSVYSELKREKVVDLTVNTEACESYERFSNISKTIRVLGWILRFIDNTRKKQKYTSEVLDSQEKEEAEYVLWKIVQGKSFSEKKDSIKGNKRVPLVIKDDEGIIRVKTKIIERDDTLDFYPILLPSV